MTFNIPVALKRRFFERSYIALVGFTTMARLGLSIAGIGDDTESKKSSLVDHSLQNPVTQTKKKNSTKRIAMRDWME
jgi:hypothetical protein